MQNDNEIVLQSIVIDLEKFENNDLSKTEFNDLYPTKGAFMTHDGAQYNFTVSSHLHIEKAVRVNLL